MRAHLPTAIAFMAGFALALAPATAEAHSSLVSSDPPAGANLDEPPGEIVLTFDGELDPTSGFSVTDTNGDEVAVGGLDLDVAGRNVLRGEVKISGPGVFTVNWTAVSIDGHEETGSHAFGYRADHGDADADHDDGDDASTPDTALPARQLPSPTAAAGLLLLLAAGGVGMRRATVNSATRR